MSGKVIRNQLKHKLVGTASGKTYDWACTEFNKGKVLANIFWTPYIHSTIRRHANLYLCLFAK